MLTIPIHCFVCRNLTRKKMISYSDSRLLNKLHNYLHLINPVSLKQLMLVYQHLNGNYRQTFLQKKSIKCI